MIAYVHEVAHEHLTVRERGCIRMESFPSFNHVKAAMNESNQDRKHESKLRSSVDEQTLVDEGKVLSTKDAAALRDKVERYLAKPFSAEPLSREAAFRYQNFMICWMLCGDIPVSRSEVLCALKVHRSFRFDADLRKCCIDTLPMGKCRTAILIHMPITDTQLFSRYVEQVRPVMLRGLKEDHGFLLTNFDGSARKSIAYVVRKVQEELLGHSAPAHSFRHRQAMDSKASGASKEVLAALCTARQHSEATSSRFYERINRKRQAELASEFLETERAKAKKRARYSGDSSSSSPFRSSSSDDAAIDVTGPEDHEDKAFGEDKDDAMKDEEVKEVKPERNEHKRPVSPSSTDTGTGGSQSMQRNKRAVSTSGASVNVGVRTKAKSARHSQDSSSTERSPSSSASPSSRSPSSSCSSDAAIDMTEEDDDHEEFGVDKDDRHDERARTVKDEEVKESKPPAHNESTANSKKPAGGSSTMGVAGGHSLSLPRKKQPGVSTGCQKDSDRYSNATSGGLDLGPDAAPMQMLVDSKKRHQKESEHSLSLLAQGGHGQDLRRSLSPSKQSSVARSRTAKVPVAAVCERQAVAVDAVPLGEVELAN